MQFTSNFNEIGLKVVPQLSWDILAEHHGIKIDEKFVLKLSKGSKNVNRKVKNSCKVFHFSSEWNFEEVLAKIDGLNPKEFQQLFIFIINCKNYRFLAENDTKSNKNLKRNKKARKIKKSLLKFGANRPIILQLTSEDENVTKHYFKEEISTGFIPINHQKKFKGFRNFPTFFNEFLNGKFENFSDELKLQNVKNRSLILRFLRTLDLKEEFFESLILEIVKSGSKVELLAALDAPYENDGRVLNNEAQYLLSDVFHAAPDKNQTEDDITKNISSENTNVSPNQQSVLLKAIEHQNKEVIEYLTFNWTHLIQQLPFDHQVKISTAAFETNQHDELCDLLNIADFPFPKNFQVKLIQHERLKGIVAERLELEAAIKSENFDNIAKFLGANSDLKVVYNANNKSAFKVAAESKKLNIYNYLNLRGFYTSNPNEKLEEFDKEAKKYVVQQRRLNVSTALTDDQCSVNLLCNRSLIHNKRITKDQEKEYRKKIRSWYEDINNIKNGQEFLDVAASCTKLKIIFDFENDTVENASLAGPNSLGVMYPTSKWIFVGSKLSDKDGIATKHREQQIKGVLAHELCHYVMKLAYDNQENPYYKHRKDVKKMFKKIVKKIDKWSWENSECSNDECNGIISSVFKLYDSKDFHPELIVRAVQILSVFDDSKEKSTHLEEKFKLLFEFWFNRVVPDLQNYLQRNEEIILFNRIIGLQSIISNKNIDLLNIKDIDSMFNQKLIIATSNIPKLLLINIHKYLKEKYEILSDSQNLYIDPQKMEIHENWDDFEQICINNKELNILVDCTKGYQDGVGKIFINKELNFIFVVSSEIQSKKLIKIFNEKGIKNASKMEINYNFADLTEESQNFLLETKINFQNNPQVSLSDLLKQDHSSNNDQITNNIIDDRLLKMLIENSQISINNEIPDKKFDLLFNPRRFWRKEDRAKWTVFQEKLLSEVENQKYVLISDQAGNGKSWAIKNFSKILREKNPTSWVTYVDLKQFIQQFKAKKDEPEFSTFMVENILKLQHKFEVKIFQKLYKDGKVFIMFDGFDEIAPNCAEFVSKLAQNFQQNGGNQLWIATRDYFEVDLQQDLNIYVSYSLMELNENEGIDIIAKSWVLMDIKDFNEYKSKEDFDEFIKTSPNYESYKQKAILIVEKVSLSENRFVGMPQLVKMIADGFKNYNESVMNLKGSNIYRQFIKNLYKRWSEEKGQIRNEASIDSQEFEFNFWKFHQYWAFASFYPNLVEIFFPDFSKNQSEWIIGEIIACGLMNMKDGQLLFLHETFREFLFADFMAKTLKKSNIRDEVIQIFAHILTAKQFTVVRIFLNDAIDDHLFLQNIQPRTQELIQNNFEMENFNDFFTKSLNNLVDFVIEIIKSLHYDKVKIILDKSIDDVTAYTNNGCIFLKFEEFFLNFVKIDDLKNLIIDHEVFLRVVFSKVEIEIFENFIAKVEAKTDREFIRKGLTIMNDKENWRGNIFFALVRSLALSADKFEKTLEILQKYLTISEIIELMEKCNKEGQNIFRYSVRGGQIENFKILWTKMENFLSSQKLSFKDFVKQKDLKDKTILHWAAKCNNVNFHEILWDFLLEIFDDCDEFLEFILQKKKFNGQNFIHLIFEENTSHKVIDLTFRKLKEKFSNDQIKEIIKSENKFEINLFVIAVHASKHLEYFLNLTKIFQKYCESEKDHLEFNKNVDKPGRISLQYMGGEFPTVKVFFVDDPISTNFLLNQSDEVFCDPYRLSQQS